VSSVISVERNLNIKANVVFTEYIVCQCVVVYFLCFIFYFGGRAGFALSKALFRKHVGPFNWGGIPYFSWIKNWRPFLFITVHVPFFVETPVRPNMLNMPKSEAVRGCFNTENFPLFSPC